MVNNKDKRLEAFGRLLDVMDELRVKCPWDRVQTFESLRSSTIEETYELVDALLDHDMKNVKKELGDLLLHVVFYSKIASEEGAFDIAHVFGDVHADTPDEVKQNWEDLKLKEKEKEHEKKRVLSGVPRTLPSMVKAYRVSQKAASAGFDWQSKEDIWQKVQEEIAEVQDAMQRGDETNKEEEFGDLFFALVNAARLYGVNAETALEKCNKKFISRFTYIEDQAEKQGVALRDLSMDQMEQLWGEAKSLEKTDKEK